MLVGVFRDAGRIAYLHDLIEHSPPLLCGKYRQEVSRTALFRIAIEVDPSLRQRSKQLLEVVAMLEQGLPGSFQRRS